MMYMYAVLDFQKKTWGQLAPKFSFLVTKAFRQIVRGLDERLERLGKTLEH